MNSTTMKIFLAIVVVGVLVDLVIAGPLPAPEPAPVAKPEPAPEPIPEPLPAAGRSNPSQRGSHRRRLRLSDGYPSQIHGHGARH